MATDSCDDLLATTPADRPTLSSRENLRRLGLLKVEDGQRFEQLFAKWREARLPRLRELEADINQTVRKAHERGQRKRNQPGRAEVSTDHDTGAGGGAWPIPLFYGGHGAKNARGFISARPARLLSSDDVFYTLEEDGVWRGLTERAMRSEIRATDPVDRLTPAHVGAMVEAVHDLAWTDKRPFDWIDEPEDAPASKDVALFANGLLDLRSGRLLPLDGSYFATAIPDFAFDPKAECPHWLQWLDERLDPVFIPTLQEALGYFMVPDTTAHRFFSLTGAPRAGKSTAKNIAEHLVGAAHVAPKQLSDLGKEFGLQDSLDKRLIVIPDAKDVPGGLRGQALERILAITGGDTISVPRKYLSTVSIHLQTRLLVLGNRQPAWIDESGALAARQVAILFDRSFAGSEDQRVEDRLMTELPGIANWALDGLRRLRANDYRFTISDKGREAVAEVRRAASPALRFAEDCLIVTGDANDVVLQDEVYDAYEDWVTREGLSGRERRSKNELMTDLATSLRGVQATQRRGLAAPLSWKGGEYRPRVLTGVKRVVAMAVDTWPVATSLP